MKRAVLTLVAVLGLGALGACETPTPYQAATPGSPQAGGYSDMQLDSTHARVTFKGNGMTSRDTVETYLLYRAAELTLHDGFDWFETVQHATDKHVETFGDPVGPYGYGWRPYWSFYGPRFGWRHWGPYWGDRYWPDDEELTTIEKYEASADIVMGHGPKPADDKHVLDAHEVVANLAGKIVHPH